MAQVEDVLGGLESSSKIQSRKSHLETMGSDGVAGIAQLGVVTPFDLFQHVGHITGFA